MSVKLSRRLLAVVLSAVVVFALTTPLSPSVYSYGGDNQSTAIWIEDNDVAEYPEGGRVRSTFSADESLFAKFYMTPDWGSATGEVVFTLDKADGPSWATINEQTHSFSEGLDVVVCPLGNPGAGRYRVSAYYLGDETYLSEERIVKFTILEATVDPAPPSAPPAAAPTPPTKSTPATSLGVASGSTKANKLTAALTEPTASFTLAPVGGIYPTGSAKFVLQKRSGSKWKALSQKAVTLSSGKASYKLAKATEAATYRLQVSYSGDSKYNAVTTAWTTVKIAKGNGTAKKSVKVYAKASTKAKKLTSFKKGKKVVITGKSGKFYKVSLKIKGKTKVGYVAKASIKVKK
jgi:hypothetical protein